MTDLSKRSHGWRVAFRLSARSARLTLGRTLLIGGLIALPVIGVSAFATVYASMIATTAESVSIELGNAGTALRVIADEGSNLVQSPTNMDMWTYDGDVEAFPDGGSVVSDITTVTPPGERVISVGVETVTVTTATGVGSMDAAVGEPWDESLEGRFTLIDGRAPVADTEAMVSASALDRLGVSLGGTLEVTMPEAAEYTIVGVLQSARQPDSRDQVFLPASYPVRDTAQTTYYLPDVSLTWDQILELNTHGVTALSRDVALDPPVGQFPENDSTGGTVLLGILVLAFSLLEVGLLAAAAFTVGARQQQRTLAVLASIGADRRTLSRVVSVSGLVVGITGTFVGIAAGIGVAALIIRVTADGSRTQYPGFHLQPVWLLGIAVLAIVASWIAAVIPARAASKFDVVAALRGALRPPKPGKRTPVIAVVVFLVGIATVVAGLAVVGYAASQLSTFTDAMSEDVVVLRHIRDLSSVGIVLLAVGPVIAQIAAIIIAPAIFRVVARGLSRFGVGTRLASRDAARNAARTVPAAAVVMSTVFLCAFVVCLLAGTQKTADANYQPQFAVGQVGVQLIGWNDDGPALYDDPAAFASAVDSSFDTDEVRVLSSSAAYGDLSPTPRAAPSYYCVVDEENYEPCAGMPEFTTGSYYGPFGQRIWVGNEDDLALILGEPVSAESQKTLAAGGIVSLYPQFVEDGQAQIDWWPLEGDLVADGEPVDHTSTLPASYQRTDKPGTYVYFMTPEAARSIGLEWDSTLVLASTLTPATQAQQDAARSAINALTNGMADITVETGPQQFAQWQWIVLLVSGVIMLAAASVAIGLARSDGRRDDAVLGAVGASPSLRRSFGFWQAIVICGTGALIGSVLGFAEYSALAGATLVDASIGIPFVLPLIPLLATVIGVPLLIAIGSWLTARPGRTHVMDRSAIA